MKHAYSSRLKIQTSVRASLDSGYLSLPLTHSLMPPSVSVPWAVRVRLCVDEKECIHARVSLNLYVLGCIEEEWPFTEQHRKKGWDKSKQAKANYSTLQHISQLSVSFPVSLACSRPQQCSDVVCSTIFGWGRTVKRLHKHARLGSGCFKSNSPMLETTGSSIPKTHFEKVKHIKPAKRNSPREK